MENIDKLTLQIMENTRKAFIEQQNNPTYTIKFDKLRMNLIRKSMEYTVEYEDISTFFIVYPYEFTYKELLKPKQRCRTRRKRR